MKPLNSNTEGCNPISSNCVIWQGPDIECIKLCKGDSVSDVVYKLATELCTLMELTDVSNYQLTCLDLLGCEPKDFNALIQILVNQICALNGNLDNAKIPSGSSTGCPDCVVNISECFYYTNEFGDRVTTMQVVDYARAIGTKMCDIINQILSINQILNDHEGRITALENEPVPTLVLPQLTPVCVSPSVPTEMNVVLAAVESQFCQLRSATGDASQLYTSIAGQCVNLNTSPALGISGTTMSSLPGWKVAPVNVADTLNNIWITICDLRTAVRTIQLTCCPSGCDGIEINMVATFDGTFLKIFLSGTIPAGFQDCDSGGNTFTISDTTGGSITQLINITSNINSITGTSINLSGSVLNLGSDFTISTDACIRNATTNSTCQFCIEYVLDNNANCPVLTLSTITDTAINYSFNVVNAPGTYAVQLWNGTGTLVLNQNVVNALIPGPVTGQFTGLTASTPYRLRLVVTIGTTTTDCPFVPVTTLPVICTAPTGVTGLIELPVECEDCGPALEFVSNPGANGWYTDDNSQFLYNRSGGVFNTIIEEESIIVAPCVSCVGGTYFQASTIAANQYVFRTDNTNGTNGVIYVYDGGAAPALVTTINLPAGIYARHLAYNPNDNKVYFVNTWNSNALNSIDLVTFAVTYDLSGNLPAIGLTTFIAINEVTNEAYVLATGGAYSFVQVINLNTYTYPTGGTITATTLGDSIDPWVGAYAPTNIEFDANGNAWFSMINTTGAGNDLIVVDGSTYGLVTFLNDSGGSYPDQGAGSTVGRNITYYPGDGTPNSDRMFVVMNDGNIYTFFTTAPYTQTLYVSLAPGGVDSIFYSKLFNKVLHFNGLTVTVYNPQDALDTYGNIVLSGVGNAQRPYELPFYNQVITGKIPDVVYIGLDENNILFCSEGLVDMYISNTGPYQWDSADSEWDPMCTWTIVDGGSSFSVTAVFTSNVTTGIMTYSIDGGLTWIALGDYKTPAQWAAGVVYAKGDIPSISYKLRISFLTDDDCGRSSSINNNYYIP